MAGDGSAAADAAGAAQADAAGAKALVALLSQLRVVTHNAPRRKEEAHARGAVQLLVGALRRREGDAECQAEGCRVLRSLFFRNGVS